MAKELEDPNLGGGMTEGGGNNDNPLWPDEPGSGEITPFDPLDPPLEPKDNQKDSYKEASNEAKLAVLKRDILGDGIKESKLKKFQELLCTGNKSSESNNFIAQVIYFDKNNTFLNLGEDLVTITNFSGSNTEGSFFITSRKYQLQAYWEWDSETISIHFDAGELFRSDGSNLDDDEHDAVMNGDIPFIENAPDAPILLFFLISCQKYPWLGYTYFSPKDSVYDISLSIRNNHDIQMVQ